MPKKKQTVTMELVNPNAAGIDVGATFHAVAVPEGRGQERVRRFGTMTQDLQDLAAWLKQCRVTTVAMESTGVYWKNLFSVLMQNDLEVFLVNAHYVRNVSGRKNDEDDAVWIQRLHSCGLLRSSYLPEDEQESLRTLVRFRKTLTQESNRHILRMQKAMELMNLKLHTVISHITGATGMAIIEAIIAGERNPENFLRLVKKGVRADGATLRKSLEGNWRPEHLFTLTESHRCYAFCKERIAACDAQIELQLTAFAAKHGNESGDKKPAIDFKKKQKTSVKTTGSIREYLQTIHGVDVLAIYGISDIAGLTLLAETGTDLSKWESEKHFVSWLNLCPNNKVTGGKVKSSRLAKKKNSAGQAFRDAANTMHKSNHWLGDYFRRMKAKGGNKYAITATAHKLATIYYNMVKNKVAFTPIDTGEYQEKYKQAKITYLERKLNQLRKDVA